jgi:hypothetical protein
VSAPDAPTGSAITRLNERLARLTERVELAEAGLLAVDRKADKALDVEVAITDGFMRLADELLGIVALLAGELAVEWAFPRACPPPDPAGAEAEAEAEAEHTTTGRPPA